MTVAMRSLLSLITVPLLCPPVTGQEGGLESARREHEHWAFRPLTASAPPPTGHAAWDAHPIDRYVRARLDLEGLVPAREADRRTLIRRLSFDLLGLPPTPEEVAGFVGDERPDAWERLVDRFLASPHYGERWGRYWLDLARYSDSNGLDENLAFGNAWRYRDYVVRSFNRDKPYDRFVHEQIAGDLLPPPDDEETLFDQWTATGFLAMGPKMLAEQDKRKLALDIVDEQVDLVGRTFLGLTVGCARCHDHKFDPLPTRDYYALAGIFVSTSTMENLAHVSRWRERELATAEQIAERTARERELEAARQELETAQRQADGSLRTRLHGELARYLLAARDATSRVRFLEAERLTRGNLRVDRSRWGSPDVAIVHTHRSGLQFAEWELDLPAGSHRLEVRYAAEQSRPMRLLLDGKVVRDEALGAVTGGWLPEHQRWHHAGTLESDGGRHVLRLERDGPVPHVDKLLVLPGGAWPEAPAGLHPGAVRQVADFVQSRPPDDPVWAPWRALASLPLEDFPGRAAERCRELLAGIPLLPPVAALIRGLPPESPRELAARYQLLFGVVDAAWRQAGTAENPPERLPDPHQERLRASLYGSASLFSLPDRTRAALLTADQRQWLVALRARRDELADALPEPGPTVLCVREGDPEDLPVHRRGNHLDLAPDAVPRGVPELLAHCLEPPTIPEDASGRLQLARWITDPRNPLTARVIANRIWQGHFGRGLVRTASNFGYRGEPPTHPRLLDWLAAELLRCDWSLKSLHRTVLLSRTYRMASDHPEGARTDPRNRLLWRQNRRRLEAEIVRDAMLAVAGTLDPTMGGSQLRVRNRGYVTNDQSANEARYNAPRRSVYLPVIRNAMYDLFTAFDYNDPSVHCSRRPSTVMPHQALLLLNSELAVEQARRFAERVLREADSDTERVDRAYALALGRRPRAGERERALAFLAVEAEEDSDAEPWTLFCQALMACNEFLYVD